MARVTVEDCVTKIPSRFELVLLASQRARDLSSGASPTVERENDKNPVVALREIADETVDFEDMRQTLVSGLQKHVEMDEPEDDTMTILAAAEKEWAGVTSGDTREAEQAAVPDEEPIAAEPAEPGAEAVDEDESLGSEDVALGTLVDDAGEGESKTDLP